MSFKDYLQSDIANVFSNTEEHGEAAAINGVSVPVVWDGDALNYRIRKNYDGLIIGDALFFISAADWAKIPRVKNPPRVDEAIQIDGKHATITLINENAGMYDVTITYAGTGR